MKLVKFEGQTTDMVGVKYVVELEAMGTYMQAGSTSFTAVSGVTALKKGYSTADVLVNAMDGVSVHDGTHAVRLTVNGIEWLMFILVADNMAIELVTPEFVMLQDKPYIDVRYVDMQEMFNIHLCNMGTGETNIVRGYVFVDEVAQSVALSNGITRDINDGIYCARTYTRVGGHLAFFHKQNDTVKYLHVPAFVRHKGY